MISIRPFWLIFRLRLPQRIFFGPNFDCGNYLFPLTHFHCAGTALIGSIVSLSTSAPFALVPFLPFINFVFPSRISLFHLPPSATSRSLCPISLSFTYAVSVKLNTKIRNIKFHISLIDVRPLRFSNDAFNWSNESDAYHPPRENTCNRTEGSLPETLNTSRAPAKSICKGDFVHFGCIYTIFRPPPESICKGDQLVLSKIWWRAKRDLCFLLRKVNDEILFSVSRQSSGPFTSIIHL